MKLGYMAIDERSGNTLKLTENKHPRGQLLAKLCRKHAAKMFVDVKDGGAKCVGYVAGGGWWRVYEVHDWTTTTQCRD